MEELKLHSEGEKQHLREIKMKFDDLRRRIMASNDLAENEKKAQLSRAKASFLEKKKEVRRKLF